MSGTRVSNAGSVPLIPIGANYETSGQIPDKPGRLTLSLDTDGNAFEVWLNDITVNDAKDRFVIGTKGRYHVVVASEIHRHDTLWNRAALYALDSPSAGSMEDPTWVIVPPATVVDFGISTGATLVYSSYVDLNVGSTIRFLAEQSIIAGADPIYISDAYCQLQYVGPYGSS